MNKKIWTTIGALGLGIAAYFLLRPSSASGYLPSASTPPSGRRRSSGGAPRETAVPSSDPGGTALTTPIFFRHAQTGVPTIYAALIQRTAEGMIAKIASNPQQTWTVTGFASATASQSVDVRISQQRAESFASALVSAGVPSENLVLEAGGPTSAFGDNSTEAGQAQNRRVQVRFS